MGKKISDLIEDIALRRIEKDFSFSRLAEKLGYSRYTLMKWEYGQRRPRLDKFIDWVEGLGGTLKVEWDDDRDNKI